jgi:hypothetical protein
MRCADDTKGDAVESEQTAKKWATWTLTHRERPKQVAGKKIHLQSNASCKPERFAPEEVDVRGRTGKGRSREFVCLSPGFDASAPIARSVCLLSVSRFVRLYLAAKVGGKKRKRKEIKTLMVVELREKRHGLNCES